MSQKERKICNYTNGHNKAFESLYTTLIFCQLNVHDTQMSRESMSTQDTPMHTCLQTQELTKLSVNSITAKQVETIMSLPETLYVHSRLYGEHLRTEVANVMIYNQHKESNKTNEMVNHAEEYINKCAHEKNLS